MDKLFKKKSQIVRVAPVPERHGGRTRTEKLGYVPMEQRLRAMHAAGLTLARARAEDHDVVGEIPDDVDMPPFPATRSQDFDLADAAELRREIEQRVAQRKRAASPPLDSAATAPEGGREGGVAGNGAKSKPEAETAETSNTNV